MPSVGGTHHIKIGSDYFLIRPGSYRKRPAPIFGARFTTGDPDFNSLSFWQHWVQHCWVGGFGAESWQDDAMFDEGVGIDASQHEVMVLSRDLGPSDRTTGNWDLDAGDAPRERIFTVFNDTLYLLAFGDDDNTPPSRLYKFVPATPAWTLLRTFSQQVVAMESFGGYLIFPLEGSNMERMDGNEAFTTFAKPAGMSEPGRAARSYRGKLYVAFQDYIWRLKDDFTWDGSTAFYIAQGTTVPAGPSRQGILHAEIHLGFLYFASENGHILRTDGNNTFDLWQFEPYVKIWGLRSFDGRLFIGAAEDLAGTNSAQAVLYQFSGAAVTELKRWGKVGFDCVPGRLRAIGSSLFFGAGNQLGFGDASGFGIARYDPVEDAYHLFAMNQDGTTYSGGSEGELRHVDDVIFYKGFIYCHVQGYGVFRTPYSFQDVTRFQATYDTTASGGSVASLNGGWYESSDFDAGTPGLMKLWNTITIHVDLPTTACTVYVEISNDGGATWYPAGGSAASATVSKTGAATRYSKAIKLQDSAVTGVGWFATRMKYRLTLRTTDTTVSPQLRGVMVRYLPIPEPNWVWDFVIVLSDDQELLDGTREAPNNATKLLNLEVAFRDQSLVNFVDVDGLSWASGGDAGVLIQNMESVLPYIGPGSEGTLEREVRIQLIEAIEAYET
jgi:hypothetical protein